MKDTREIFDAVTAALNAHDAAAITRNYSPDVVLSAPEGSFTGRDQAAEYFAGFLDSFPDLHVNAWSKVTSGALVVDEWTLTGTNTGPLHLTDGSTLPATGRVVTVRGCDVAAVEDGHVISHRLYYDQADLFTQLGLAS